MLKVIIPSLPQSFDPTQLKLIEHFMLLQMTCQTLVSVDGDGNLVGDLADRWHISSDGKEIRVWLNEKSVFSNGNKVTAEDVV
jgi:peptide/nickel transport system substrate-binding protein